MAKPARNIRLLRDGDVEDYLAARRESLIAAPFSFKASPDDDFVSDPASVREYLRRAPDAVILGAFDDRLVGCVGLYRDRHVKASHKAHLWGMYVTPARRRTGIASGLLRAAIRHAESLPGVTRLLLGVSSGAPEAQRLYANAGFLAWGHEPEALCHDGRMISETHMALRLREP